MSRAINVVPFVARAGWYCWVSGCSVNLAHRRRRCGPLASVQIESPFCARGGARRRGEYEFHRAGRKSCWALSLLYVSRMKSVSALRRTLFMHTTCYALYRQPMAPLRYSANPSAPGFPTRQKKSIFIIASGILPYITSISKLYEYFFLLNMSILFYYFYEYVYE